MLRSMSNGCRALAARALVRVSAWRVPVCRVPALRVPARSLVCPARRAMLALALLLAGGPATVAPAFAQGAQPAAASYPTRPVTLIVPFAAGSGTDGVARLVAERLGAALGQPVVVDNRAGANGQVAAQLVRNAAPDGYTLLMTTNTTHSANPALVANLKYDAVRDFTPVARVGELPFVLVVRASDAATDLRGWIDAVRAAPGRYSYATPNSTSLVASETIRRIARLEMTGVPYRSSPQAMADLIGGSVQMYVVDIGSGLQMIRGGQVRALGVTTAKPVDLLPGVPPIASAVPGFDLTSWNGIFGPAGLPEAVVARLNEALHRVLAERRLRDELQAMGFELWPSATPDEFAGYVAQQLRHWSRLIGDAGIPKQ